MTSHTLSVHYYFLVYFSFTAEVWLKLDLSFSNGPHPIFCSVDNDVCLWIQHGNVLARYGEHEIMADDKIKANVWYNLMMRYSFPGEFFQ